MSRAAPFSLASGHRDMAAVLSALIFGLVGFVVLYPGANLLLSSFQVGPFEAPTGYGLDNWHDAFASRYVVRAIYNTLSLSLTRQAIAFVLGVLIAWLIARTNLPGAAWLEFGFWIALFMPALPVAMSWVLLAGSRSGLLNPIIERLPFVQHSGLNIYSWWGIVWVHLMTSTLAVKVFLLVPAFRNMDASLEDAARTCGSNIFGALIRVVVPIMMPTIAVVTLLGLIRSMQAFEVELILGTPAQIDVYSTIIYRAMDQQPPQNGLASVLSMSFVGLIIPFVILQQWHSSRHAVATLGGRFSARVQDLGVWRWPLFSLVALLLVIMTVIPLAALLLGSFMKIFGNLSLPEPWTLRNWAAAFTRTDIVRAFWNTLRLGTASSILGMSLFTLLAYMIVKTRFAGRRLLDTLTWLPTVIPGIVISLGVLQMFVGTAVLRPLYGTSWALILALTLGSITVGTQILKGALQQLSSELEEASWASGASRLYTFFHIILPLIVPSVALVGLQVFATAISAVGLVAMLGTGQNQPLSMLQLIFMDSGQFELATIVGLIIMAISLLAALLARFVGLRSRIRFSGARAS